MQGVKILHGMKHDHIVRGEDIAKVWEWHRTKLQGLKVLQRYGMTTDNIARGEDIAKVWDGTEPHCKE